MILDRNEATEFFSCVIREQRECALTNATPDAASHETCLKFEYNEIGTAVVPDHSVTGVNIIANASYEAAFDLCCLLSSSKINAPFGMSESIFLSVQMDEEQYNDTTRSLKDLTQKQGSFAERASTFSEYVKREGCEPSSLRCHVGLYENILPSRPSKGKQQIAISLRSVHSDSTKAIKTAIDSLVKESAKVDSLKNALKNEAISDRDELECLQNEHDAIAASFAQDYNKLLELIDKSQKISERSNRNIAYHIARDLGIDMGKQATSKSTAIASHSLYSSFTSFENTYSRGSKTESSGTSLPHVNIHLGSVPVDASTTQGVNVAMFHSPFKGSTVFSFSPEARKKFTGAGTSVFDIPSSHSTTCDRRQPSTSLLHTLKTENVVTIAPPTCKYANKHKTLDTDEDSYKSLLICPYLYNLAYSTNSIVSRIQTIATFYGPVIDYEKLEPIKNIRDLSSFMTTVEKNNDGYIYVPDKEGDIAKMVSAMFPATFYEILQPSTAILNEKKHVLGWKLRPETIETICTRSVC
jgi:hypothetical protein